MPESRFDSLMSMREFAEKLILGRTTVHNLVQKGDTPPLFDLNAGGKNANYRVKPEDYEYWLRAHAINPLPGSELTAEDVAKRPWLLEIIQKQIGDQEGKEPKGIVFKNQPWVQAILNRTNSSSSER